MRRRTGTTVLITGAGHGIGRACALRLAEEGARVAVADLDGEAAERVVGELPEVVGGHLAITLDVTRADSVEAAFADLETAFGGLDTLVNVAGGNMPHGTFEETGDEVWQHMVDLNLLGVVRCCRAAVPLLRHSTSTPSIISITSVNGLTALGQEPYSAAKAGIPSLTANLAVSLGPDGIRVNAVAPGTVRTRVWDDHEGGADRMLDLYPLGRVGEPEDIAAAVAFLASGDASWITGHTLPVDGGLMTNH
ncbi:MAG TPA: SDR family oxidoreductase [Plantibacter sp.]|uniref:SDR family NAD(P)-dependent oxidoreductase n=1 Tax=unclassified Plantibacter TaxID=2624265 RepID=UPI002BCED570|nr:SDR family oxidoreductase [Plantibacter sp.]